MFAVALTLQVVTLVFHQVTTHVDLHPFNNIRHYTRHERIVEGSVNGLVMTIPIALLLVDRTATVAISAAMFSLLFCMEGLMWWLPYFTGVSIPALVQGDEPWDVTHERLFGSTVTVLPRIKAHPRPNLEHTILHALTGAAAVAAWLLLAR